MSVCALVFFMLARYRLWQGERGLRQAGYLEPRRSRFSLWLPLVYLTLALLLMLFAFVRLSAGVEAPAQMQLNVLLHCPEADEAEFGQAKALLLQLRERLPNWEFSLLSFAGKPMLDLPPGKNAALWRQALAEAVAEPWQGRGAAVASALRLAEQKMPPVQGGGQLHLLLPMSGFWSQTDSFAAGAWTDRRWPCLVYSRRPPERAQLVALKAAWSGAKQPYRLLFYDDAPSAARLALELRRLARAVPEPAAQAQQRLALLAGAALLCLVLISSRFDLPRVALLKKTLMLLGATSLLLQAQNPGQIWRQAAALAAETQNPEALRQAYELYAQLLKMQPGDCLAAEGLEYSLLAWEQTKKEPRAGADQVPSNDMTSEQEPATAEAKRKSAAEGMEADWQNIQTGDDRIYPQIKTYGSWRKLLRRQKRIGH